MAYPLFELVPIIRVREETQKASAAHGTDPEEETTRKWPGVRLCVQNHHETTSTVVLVCNNGKIKDWLNNDQLTPKRLGKTSNTNLYMTGSSVQFSSVVIVKRTTKVAVPVIYSINVWFFSFFLH